MSRRRCGPCTAASFPRSLSCSLGSLQYYIMEERGRVEQLMESGELQKGDQPAREQEGRYARINDMAVSRKIRDYLALDQQMEEFYRTEYYNRQLFRLR